MVTVPTLSPDIHEKSDKQSYLSWFANIRSVLKNWAQVWKIICKGVLKTNDVNHLMPPKLNLGCYENG